MSLTEREKQTKNRYEENAEEWLEVSGGRNRGSYWSVEMRDLWWKLPLNGKVVEIGCGPSTDGKYLQAMKLDCISFDYAASMLTIAKELNPKGKLAQMDTYNIGLPDNSFDGFWATASLLHLEKPQKALKEIARVTKDKGYGFISVKEGEGEGIDPRTGYFFKYYKNEEFISILENLGFDILWAKSRPGSLNHPWLTYLVRVNKW